MSKFEKGTTVLHIVNNRLKRGTILSIYDTLNVAVVSFEDGSTEKVKLSDLAISYEEKRRQEPEKIREEKPSNPVEKSEITITPVEFRKKVVDLATEKSMNGKFKEGFVITYIGAELHKALFYDDAVNNE